MAPCAAWRPNSLDRKNGQSCCEELVLGKLPRRLGGLCNELCGGYARVVKLRAVLGWLEVGGGVLGAVIDRSLCRIRICDLVMP